MDVAIIRAWERLNEALCRDCGRPVAIHATDTPADYLPASLTCTATKALDAFLADHRAKKKAADAAELKAGRTPEAGLRWLTYTRAEGPPSFEGGIWS